MTTAMPTTDRRTVPGTWTLDADHTLVGFAVKHMMFTTVRGKFNEVSGSIVADPDRPEQAAVSVDIVASSIDTGVEARDAHLRSADFLHADAHPSLTFRSKRVEGAPREAGDRFTVVGDLTIRGVTREVSLAAIYDGSGRDPWGSEKVGFSARTTIDRREFDLTWNQALEAGGILVGNDIIIDIQVQASRSDS